MDVFPDETLLEIFSYLPSKDLLSCLTVTGRWNLILRDPALWTVLDFSRTKISVRKIDKDLHWKILTTRNTKLSTVDWSPALFCPNKLRSLDLTSAKISQRSLGQLLGFTSELKYLRLRGCRLNNAACEAIAANSKLKLLDLSKTKVPIHVLDRFFSIFKACGMLEDVNLCNSDRAMFILRYYIRSSTWLTMRDINLGYADIREIVLPNLTYLDLNGGTSKNARKLMELFNLCAFKRRHQNERREIGSNEIEESDEKESEEESVEMESEEDSDKTDSEEESDKTDSEEESDEKESEEESDDEESEVSE